MALIADWGPECAAQAVVMPSSCYYPSCSQLRTLFCLQVVELLELAPLCHTSDTKDLERGLLRSRQSTLDSLLHGSQDYEALPTLQLCAMKGLPVCPVCKSAQACRLEQAAES
jgi:hypothetical protein